MCRREEKSERSEQKNKNFSPGETAFILPPLLPLAHSVSDSPETDDTFVNFTPNSSQFNLVGTLLGFLIWQSENNINYLEPDIGLYRQVV